MKTGGSSGGYDGGSMKEDEATFDAFAKYLASFVTSYATENITIEAIHPQNEPGFSQNYPSCSWTGGGMADFIANYLGPEFTEQGITAQIFIGTMSNSSSDGALMQTVMQNQTAKGYIKGYGLQWGMLSTIGSLGLDSNLQIWQTEHKCGNYPFSGQTLAPGIPGTIAGHVQPAPNNHAYAEESWGLIREWIKAGVTSYSAWNMVLDTSGVGEIDTTRIWAQNALLTVDRSGKKLNLTPTYFVFRHVSQYVDPGATRLDVTGGDALAFKNKDGSVTTVMYNNAAAKDVTVAVLGKKVSFNLPERGWATLNVNP
jgi:glucosylceramidase